MSNSHDEIRKLLKASRQMLAPKNHISETNQIRSKHGLITEQESSGYEVFQKANIAKSVEDTINKDESNKEDKQTSYRVSGHEIILHGKTESELELTEDEKKAFQDTITEFSTEVSKLVMFNPLNLYPNSVEWSGTITEFDLKFTYKIPEVDGVYLETAMIKTGDDFMDVVKKLKMYYEKFKSKWSTILQNRQTTKADEEND
jgi:hypothetical protein